MTLIAAGTPVDQYGIVYPKGHPNYRPPGTKPANYDQQVAFYKSPFMEGTAVPGHANYGKDPTGGQQGSPFGQPQGGGSPFGQPSYGGGQQGGYPSGGRGQQGGQPYSAPSKTARAPVLPSQWQVDPNDSTNMINVAGWANQSRAGNGRQQGSPFGQPQGGGSPFGQPSYGGGQQGGYPSGGGGQPQPGNQAGGQQPGGYPSSGGQSPTSPYLNRGPRVIGPYSQPQGGNTPQPPSSANGGGMGAGQNMTYQGLVNEGYHPDYAKRFMAGEMNPKPQQGNQYYGNSGNARPIQ